MSNQATLKVNSCKDTEFEFDVEIQGLNEENTAAAEVRFVVLEVNGQFDAAIKCSRTTTNRWLVRIPPLNLTSVQQPFQIEVIVDGYYFVPVSGNLFVVSTPKIDLSAQETSKPIVSATFAVIEEPAFFEGREPVKTRRLLEASEMSLKECHDVARKVQVASKIMKKASAVLENIVDVDNLNNKVIAGTLETVRQAIDLVEMKVYVIE